MSLPDLVARLVELESRQTPQGWSPGDAVLRSALERRVLALVSSAEAGERRTTARLICCLPVEVHTETGQVRGTVRDIGLGGVYIQTGAVLAFGDHVELEIDADGQRGMRVRGQVAWVHMPGKQGIGVSFAESSAGPQQRRLRRFVLELLKEERTE